MKVWIAAVIALSCSSEAQQPPPPEREAPPQEAPPNVPVVEESNAAPSLAIGQPAVSMNVPSPPGFSLPITEPGEYRIDVIATGDADPILYLYRERTLVARDDDGGEAQNARAVLFLDAGTYTIHIGEKNGRPFDVTVQAQPLEPLDPELTLELGPHATPLTFPELPLLRRAENDRDAAKAVRVSIAAAGHYVCSVRMDNGRIARMQLVRDGRVTGAGAQRLTAISAVIEADLTAGDYELRVWDAEYRWDMTAMVMCEARAAE